MRTKSNSQLLMKHQFKTLTAKRLHLRPLKHLLPHLRRKRLLLKRPLRRSKTLQLPSQLPKQRMLSLLQLKVNTEWPTLVCVHLYNSLPRRCSGISPEQSPQKRLHAVHSALRQ